MGKIKQIRRKITDTLIYARVLSRLDFAATYSVKVLKPTDIDDMIAAKKLHAAVYLAIGFVDQSDIREDIIHDGSDPHQHHSQYFVVKRGNAVVAVARQITYKGSGPYHESFPILDKALLHERSRRHILAIHPQEITEISALVKKSGESPLVPILLYRELWRHSLRYKHRVWIMACDPRLYERLKLLFGPALVRIGQTTPYKGGDIIPVTITIAKGIKYLQTAKKARRRDFFNIHTRAAHFITRPELPHEPKV